MPPNPPTPKPPITNTMPPEPPSRTSLLTASQSFTSAFASHTLPSIILRTHFSTSSPSSILVHEHGLPQLAPFLGRPFHGLDGAAAYFELIGQCLSYSDMTFSDYLVDPEQRRVSVRGAARFTWTETGQSWDEVFTYVLGFDDELRVVSYEIWADSGAAYLARKGLLEEVARE